MPIPAAVLAPIVNALSFACNRFVQVEAFGGVPLSIFQKRVGPSGRGRYHSILSQPGGQVKIVVRLLGFCALVASMVTAGMAQDILSADVPFSFIVNSKEMPAGKYSVESIQSADSKLLVIRDENNAALVLSMFLNSANGDPKLVFRRFGDQVFLTSVTGFDHEYEFPVGTPKIRQTTKTAQVSEIPLLAGK
jgi:hypothetical protein